MVLGRNMYECRRNMADSGLITVVDELFWIRECAKHFTARITLS
jgi:hypothetical protein